MKIFTKKMLVMLTALMLVVGLTACDNNSNNDDDLNCQAGQIEQNGECVDEPLECPDGQVEENGVCVDEPVDCPVGQIEENGVCVDDPNTSDDDVAPVITGMSDLRFRIGDEDPNYIGCLTAIDDVDGDITDGIVVDTSNVDFTTEGTYVITVTAEDAAGNSTSEDMNLIVMSATLDNENTAKLDIAGLCVDIKTLELRSFTTNGSYIYWSTSHPEVLSNRGFVFPPPVGSDDVTVTLTARVVNGAYQEEVTFDYVVEANEEVTVTSKISVPFTGTSEEYVTTDDPDVAMYFVDNGSLPYMDIEEFLNMLDGAIDPTVFVYEQTADDELTISYTSEFEDVDGTMVTETYTAVIDFTENTFTVNNYDFFSGYEAETESDYGEGLNYVDVEYVDPHSVTIPLGDYNFDLVIYDDEGETKYLMPFHVNNLLFLSSMYYDAYYNGDEIRGFSYLLDDPDNTYMDALRTSSLNNSGMPEDVRWASVNFLALTFDYFYGLKEDQGVDSYKSMIANRASNFIEKSEAVLYDSIFTLVYDLDDLHTSHSYTGTYLSPYSLGLSISDLGERSTAFYEDGIWAMDDLLEAKYGSVDAMPDHEIIDAEQTTAVIHLTGFTIDTPDEFKAFLDGLPASVENVVIDLSYNTGGNLGAVLRIFGYMTEDVYGYHSQNPADGSAYSVWMDSDYVAYDYNWYIVTSKVTFSAANLMASMALEQDLATVIGQPSSGGASSIGHFTTPDGSGIIISSNSVLSTRVGNEIDGYEYLSIEYGITPEYIMSNVTDDAEIMAIIQQDQAQ